MSESINSRDMTVAAFIGFQPGLPPGEAARFDSWLDFRRRVAGPVRSGRAWTDVTHAVHGYFLNGGTRCDVVATDDPDDLTPALAALAERDDVAIVAAPGRTDAATYAALTAHCEERRDRLAILDGPAQIDDAVLKVMAGAAGEANGWRMPPPSPGGFTTLYAPWIRVADPEAPGGGTLLAPPSGHIAGAWARHDRTQGVHRAPATLAVAGALDVARRFTSEEQAQIHPHGVNALRVFPAGGVLIWGARTLSPEAEWRYVNVRRLLTMITTSVCRGLAWAVFEPNAEPLWARIRGEVENFLYGQWRAGALLAPTPDQAFFVRCDRATMTQADIDSGRLVAMIGVAPVRPAEFVVIRIGWQDGRCDD